MRNKRLLLAIIINIMIYIIIGIMLSVHIETKEFSINKINYKTENLPETYNNSEGSLPLKLTKVDSESSNILLPGAIFKLTDLQGNIVKGEDGTPIGEYIGPEIDTNINFISNGEYKWVNTSGVWESNSKGISNSKSIMVSEPIIIEDEQAVLSFDWALSSERDYDYITYSIKNNEQIIKTGELKGTYSGSDSSNLEFETVETFLEKGTYEIEFTYIKDATTDFGLDAGFVKNVKVGGYYSLTTDENGEIIVDLPNGFYKIIETAAPEGYTINEKENERTYFFGIGNELEEKKNYTLEWAKSISGQGFSNIYDIKALDEGGYIVVGSFAGEGDFKKSNGETDTSKGDVKEYDAYIAKYNNDGIFEWVTTYGTKNADEFHSVDIASDGYVVVGYEINDNYEDGLIVKFDKSGKQLWKKNIVGELKDELRDVAVLSTGEIIVVGRTYSENVKISETNNMKNHGNYDGFVICYDSLGNYKWHKEIYGANNIDVTSVAETRDGIVLSANFLGSINVNGNVINSLGNQDSVLIKYNKNGTYLNHAIIGGSSNEAIEEITALPDGSIFCAGTYASTSLKLGNTNVSVISDAIDFASGLAVKFSSQLEYNAHYTIGGHAPADIKFTSVVPLKKGGILIGGWFHGAIDMNNDGINEYDAGDVMYGDGVLIELNENAEFLWGTNISGNSFNATYGVAQLSDEGYVAVGNFDSDILSVKGYAQIDNTLQLTGEDNGILTKKGYNDSFMIKFQKDVTEIKIPRQNEITVSNKAKEYEITTNVNPIIIDVINQETGGREEKLVNGGTISGENEAPYEKVKYNKNSVNPIKATPNPGYEVKSITVNGVEIEFTENADKTVDLEKFINVTEDKDVVVEFRKVTESVKVTKVWEDDNNKLETRPSSIEVKLVATVNGTEYIIPDRVETNITLDNSNWEYIWPSLYKYDENGNLIEYSVKENLDSKSKIIYTSNVAISNENEYVITLTNTYKVPDEKIDFIVNKYWNDNNNQNNKRPENLELLVTRNSKVIANQILSSQISELTVSSYNEEGRAVSPNISYTFELPKYDEKGNEIEYQADEREVNENDLYFYNKTVNKSEKTEVDGKITYTTDIINTFNVPKDTIDIEVTKIWEDQNNEKEKRPNSLELQIYHFKGTEKIIDKTGTLDTTSKGDTENDTNENNVFKYLFEGLAKYDEGGNEITYLVEEKGDLTFYTSTTSEKTKIENAEKEIYAIILVNTFTIPDEKITITGEKKWNDNNNVNQKRPQNLKISLLKNEEVIDTKIVTETDNWKAVFENNPKYDQDANEIVYFIKEEAVNSDDLKFYTADAEKVQVINNTATIINNFTVPDETKEITAIKTWNDGNKDRLKEIYLILTSDDGREFKQKISEPINSDTSQNSNTWIYKYTVPKYNSKTGNEAVYKLSEQGINEGDLNKYIQSIDGYNITNTLIIKDLVVTKDGPETINTINTPLEYKIGYSASIESSYKDDVKVIIVDTLPYAIDTSKPYELNGGTYNESDNTIRWTGTYNFESNTITWNNSGSPVVEEVDLIDATSKIINVSKTISFTYKGINISDNNKIIHNEVKGYLELLDGGRAEATAEVDTLTDFTKTIKVEKEWQGDTVIDNDGNETAIGRPDRINVELNNADQLIENKTITSERGWIGIWEKLPIYNTETNEEIKYNVTENNVPEGYYSKISERVESENTIIYTVTNYKSGKIAITKVDSRDEEKKLGGAQFKLEKLVEVDGKQEIDSSFDPITIITSGNGEAIFDNLEWGTYRITEIEAPEGYKISKKGIEIVEVNGDSQENLDIKITIKNDKAYILPVTGGRGINIIISVVVCLLTIMTAIKIKIFNTRIPGMPKRRNKRKLDNKPKRRKRKI